MNVYQTQLMTLRFQGKILCMPIRIKDLLLLEGKVEQKFSRLSGLRINIYPSRINIIISERSQEATVYLQELTSTLLSRRLCPVHLLGNTSQDWQSIPQFLSNSKSSQTIFYPLLF